LAISPSAVPTSPSRASARRVSDSIRVPVASFGATVSSMACMIVGAPAITITLPIQRPGAPETWLWGLPPGHQQGARGAPLRRTDPQGDRLPIARREQPQPLPDARRREGLRRAIRRKERRRQAWPLHAGDGETRAALSRRDATRAQGPASVRPAAMTNSIGALCGGNYGDTLHITRLRRSAVHSCKDIVSARRDIQL